MAPKIRDIKIQFPTLDRFSPSDVRYFGDLFTQMYLFSCCTIRISFFTEMTIELRAELFCELQHLNISILPRSIGEFAHLARHNAPSLQSLEFWATLQSGVRDLIQDSEGNVFVYPQLQ
ncbi:hypothetical protein H4R26_003934, partial [Coemansia thaxteri]